jgi:hypothetical protein
MKGKPKSKAAPKAPKVHPDLAGFEMDIDSFGHITTTLNRDILNTFLDKEMPEDKKNKPKKDESNEG